MPHRPAAFSLRASSALLGAALFALFWARPSTADHDTLIVTPPTPPPPPIIESIPPGGFHSGRDGTWWPVPTHVPGALQLDGEAHLSLEPPVVLADVGERHGHTMIFDPVRQRFLLFGGTKLPNQVYFNDVWERQLNGGDDWTPLVVTGGPPAGRWSHAAAYDPVGDRMIVHGGRATDYFGDVWQLSLSGTPAWQEIQPTGTPPSARAWHTCVFDVAHNRLVIHGGRNLSFLTDTWFLSFDPLPAQWYPATPFGTPPTARYGHVAVLDATRDRMVIYGGLGTETYSDVWTLSLGTSQAWTLRSNAQTPGRRDGSSAVLDPTGNRMLIFGGRQPAGIHDQNLWALDLSTFAWALVSPSGSPPGIRRQAAMAIDPVTRRAILQGGVEGSLRTLNDTWGLTLDGAPAWTKLQPVPPVITSFTPTNGSAGTLVTISGIGFSGASSVTFNHALSSFTVVSASEIRATVPNTATSGRIRVTTPLGTGTSGIDFTLAPPDIASFAPSSGHAGMTVFISGSNLQGATGVTFNQATSIFTVVSGSEIRATVPNAATSGRIRVTTLGGTATSASDFTVTPVPAPDIASFSPTSGPVGTVVTITGSYFLGVSSVTFNGSLSGFAMISSTSIQATVPGSASTGRIRVATPSGTAVSASDFTVLLPPAVITSGAHRFGAAGDFDASRNRHVVVGGAYQDFPINIPTYLNDAYGLRIGLDSSWVRIAYSGTPMSPRLGPSAVYDPIRDRLLIFGGHSGSFRNDLHELQFAPSPIMQPLEVPGGPSPRDFHAAVYDPLRDRMLVFGGNSGDAALGDLWELTLDGTPAWRLLDAGNPSGPKRMLAGMVLDPFADRLVLFGGWAPGSRNDLWQYLLSGPGGWTPIEVAGEVPGPRHSFTFRLDPLGQRAILHSGKHEETYSLYSGTWEYPLVGPPQWVLLASGGEAPVPRMSHLCVVDPVHNRMLLSGGFSSTNTLDDVWRLQWSIDQPTPAAMSFRVDAVTEDAVELTGHVGLSEGASCRLERSSDGTGWSPRAEIFPDASGAVHFVDRQVVRGEILYYRLAIEVRGEWVRSEEIRVQLPATSHFALHGFSPNPSNGEVRVSFRLTESEPATVELIDVSGRRVASRRVETPAIGEGAIGFAGERLSPGLYFVRLTQGQRSSVCRGIVAP